MIQLVVPETARAERWLRAVDDPLVELLVATYLDGVDADRPSLVAEIVKSTAIQTALADQRADGSWGARYSQRNRVLPTLWMTKALAELGLAVISSWTRAAEFLAETAHTDDDVFAIDGRRDGVLSCYVGIAATSYLLGGRPDLAEPQIRWIRDHQQVKRASRDLRPSPAGDWSDHLAVRYGGCMSDTTCLVGLAKTGQALRCWSTTHPDHEVEALLRVIQERFLERHLYRCADGSTLPLGVTPESAERWLDLTYPLDWRTDLVEIIDLVAAEDRDTRLQPALDHLASTQLEDGSWPLQRTFRPGALPLLERRSATRGSPYATLRVLLALARFRTSAESTDRV